MNMKEFSDYIIDVANRNSIAISNLQLQKVMFFGLRYALQNKIYDENFVNQLYDEKFLVWRYGPVIESIYDKYQIYGAEPLIEAPDVNQLFVDAQLENKLCELLREKPFDLVNKSHQDEYWQRNQKYISGWRSDVEYSIRSVRTGE
ncbi:hypothetical protein NFX39_02170 [Fructobacillus sp. W13]|uniref:Antitoxin SocA-like Panacea domain-containing protein n=1 Tax=Fructobacillus apis TaxID=2935017 RepID=A0ABT0ZPI6_9LACO|nr:hypothetical protein [Fructobacillus apis]MCO0831901.1 hypothetical protein [Fructobacillus apis]